MNRTIKKEYYSQRIIAAKQDSKELWKTLNEIMGRRFTGGASYVESDGVFLTKPSDIANYFNDYFINKVKTLREKMDNTVSDYLKPIREHVMSGKSCTFHFKPVD